MKGIFSSFEPQCLARPNVALQRPAISPLNRVCCKRWLCAGSSGKRHLALDSEDRFSINTVDQFNVRIWLVLLLLNSDGCWNRFQFIETNETASACVTTITVVNDATLSFGRAAQLQNRER